jgi:hypothetical protein
MEGPPPDGPRGFFVVHRLPDPFRRGPGASLSLAGFAATLLVRLARADGLRGCGGGENQGQQRHQAKTPEGPGHTYGSVKRLETAGHTTDDTPIRSVATRNQRLSGIASSLVARRGPRHPTTANPANSGSAGLSRGVSEGTRTPDRLDHNGELERLAMPARGLIGGELVKRALGVRCEPLCFGCQRSRRDPGSDPPQDSRLWPIARVRRALPGRLLIGHCDSA